MALPRPPPVSAAVSEMARLVVATGDSVSAADGGGRQAAARAAAPAEGSARCSTISSR